MAARPIWKGHVSFGLVSVPVTLYPAEQRNELQFHLIDKRNSGRVRYKRVNAETGEEVPWDCIVKGYEHEDGRYVLLSDEELAEVDADLTREIGIEQFVRKEEIDPIYFDKPYYVEPRKGGTKSYALLRETLRLSDKIGIARVVIRSREHLAALMVRDGVLVLELIRFPAELRDIDFIDVPGAEGGSVKMGQKEIDMAVQLVESMTAQWNPKEFRDEYRERLENYIEEKIERGEFSAGSVVDAKEEEETEGEDEEVVDLMDYLKKSVERAKGKGTERKRAAGPKKPGRRKGKKPAARKKTAGKRQSA